MSLSDSARRGYPNQKYMKSLKIFPIDISVSFSLILFDYLSLLWPIHPRLTGKSGFYLSIFLKRAGVKHTGSKLPQDFYSFAYVEI